ncbi:MAG: hypothetical protein IJT23_04595 [Clostridia bacterium]|nr:hypothetical protein [Clostridia bacterium]
MSNLILNLDNWDKKDKKLVFPNTPDGSNWENKGLVHCNKYTADIFNWYAFNFDCEITGTQKVEVKVGLLDFGDVNIVDNVDYYTWSATVFGNGKVNITAPLEQFNLMSVMSAKWRFLRSVEINVPVSNLKAVRGKGVYADAPIKSKSANAGEEIEYRLNIVNCMDTPQAINFVFEKNGREVLCPYVDNDEFILSPYEERECIVKTVMSERIAPGGFEKHILHIIPNGSGALSHTVKLYSVRYLPHPYITLTDSGWQEVREKIKKYPWAKDKFNIQYQRAKDWEVPEIGDHWHGMFETKNSDECFNCAACYYLTGEIEFAKKSALFLTRLSDREKGYPVRMKAGSQQLVHEGEFFKYVSRAYDIIHDSGVLSEKDHEDIRHTFRLFIEFLDWALSDGGISNWTLAECVGAMYCSMALQDRERIERFINGTGGIVEHMSAGIFDDGWWCECSIGYNQMVAGLFSECAIALRPWGINIAHLWAEPNYSRKVHNAGAHMDGLSWDIYGPTTKNYRCIEDIWDSLVVLADDRSIVQGVNDSSEERLEGASRASYDSRYDIAYALYKKPEYAKIIINSGDDVYRDLFYGVGELPDIENDYSTRSKCFDNGGIAILRTNKAGRKKSEQIMASLKYGSHGGAHGHYDRCALNAVSRNGRALFNPENIWYSYGTFMYKFFVQTSITHNMVTVDLKMQDPSEAKRTMFYEGETFKAVALENHAVWSNPPYGGWCVRTEEPTLKERAWVEGRYLEIPDDAPRYSVRTDFTEPITQRRCMVLTDDYVVCFDYMQGEKEHNYDCIYHLKGLKSIDGDITNHTSMEQLENNPVSSAQFITEVDKYDTNGSVKLEFAHNYTDKEAGKAAWIGIHPFRSGHNVVGIEHADLYYPNDGAKLYVGCDPEFYDVSKRLYYSVEADGKNIADGKLGAWILGREHIDTDVSGAHTLKISVRTEDGTIDHALVRKTQKTIFLGDPYFVTDTGDKVYLSDMEYTTENVDNGMGVGVDYQGGPVKIQTKLYKRAIPADVIDTEKTGIITVNLDKINAKRFISDIGGDYPLGDESDRRRFVSLRKRGISANFISILEPYEKNSAIERVEYITDTEVCVYLKDGSMDKLNAYGMDTGDIKISVTKYMDGKIISEENTMLDNEVSM